MLIYLSRGMLYLKRMVLVGHECRPLGKKCRDCFPGLHSVWESNKYKFKSHSFHMVEAGTNKLCHSPHPHPTPHFSDMNLDFGNDQRQPSIAAVTLKIRRVTSWMSEWLQLPDLLFMMVAYSGGKKKSASGKERGTRMEFHESGDL